MRRSGEITTRSAVTRTRQRERAGFATEDQQSIWELRPWELASGKTSPRARSPLAVVPEGCRRAASGQGARPLLGRRARGRARGGSHSPPDEPRDDERRIPYLSSKSLRRVASSLFLIVVSSLVSRPSMAAPQDETAKQMPRHAHASRSRRMGVRSGVPGRRSVLRRGRSAFECLSGRVRTQMGLRPRLSERRPSLRGDRSARGSRFCLLARAGSAIEGIDKPVSPGVAVAVPENGYLDDSGNHCCVNAGSA